MVQETEHSQTPQPPILIAAPPGPQPDVLDEVSKRKVSPSRQGTPDRKPSPTVKQRGHTLRLALPQAIR